MSMLALPETECQEILALFRLHLPHVPDIWLQELAGNYGLDAVVDIDPNDVISILSVPGELHRIQIPLEEHEPSEEVHRRMYNELAAHDIEPKQITACLLTIHDSSAKLREISELIRLFIADYPAHAKETGWSWYVTSPGKRIRKMVRTFVVAG